MYCIIVIFQMLNNTGKIKVNSISYNIKNIQSIAKFIFICIFISDRDLKPHSQK